MIINLNTRLINFLILALRTLSVILPHFVRSSLETVPAGQDVQETVSVCSDIQFTGHFVQIETVLSRYVPTPHLTEIFEIIDRPQDLVNTNFLQPLFATNKE